MKVGTKFENLNVQPFKDWFKENECETLQDLQKIICYDAHWNKMICQCNMPLDFFVELKRQVSEIVDERIRVHLSKINKNTDKRIRRCPRFKSKPPWLSSSSDNSWDLEDDSSSDNLHEMPTSNPSQHSQIRRQHDERLEKAVFNQDDYPQNFLVRILRHQGAGFLGFVAAFPWTVIINPSDDKPVYNSTNSSSGRFSKRATCWGRKSIELERNSTNVCFKCLHWNLYKVRKLFQRIC